MRRCQLGVVVCEGTANVRRCQLGVVGCVHRLLYKLCNVFGWCGQPGVKLAYVTLVGGGNYTRTSKSRDVEVRQVILDKKVKDVIDVSTVVMAR